MKAETTSTEMANRWRELVISVCALVVLTAVFWLGSHGLATRGGSDANGVGQSDLGQCDCEDCCHCEDPEGEEIEYPEIFTMPTFRDLRESIEELRDARNNMARLAVENDGQRILIAADRYREAADEVQAGFAKLKTRVDPDAFACVSEYLLYSHSPDEQCALAAWELGRFAEEIGH